MTQINTAELSQLTHVDQALMWCVVELYTSNHHPDNVWLSDNAAVRADAVNLISWNVTQDESGIGRFVFAGLLPVVNISPLAAKRSILECVKSYSSFQLQGEQIAYPTSGKGLQLPTIPEFIESLEQLLVWLVQIVEGVTRYIKLLNSAIAAGATSGEAHTIEINETGVTIGIPTSLAEAIAAAPASDPTSAEAIISQYENPISNFQLVPEYFYNFTDRVGAGSDSGGGVDGGGGEPKPVDPGSGNNQTTIDTLPVCKEQDPKIISYSKDGILNLVSSNLI